MIKPNILANNVFYYYADLQKAWDFYQNILGFETVADYGFATVSYTHLTLPTIA